MERQPVTDLTGHPTVVRIYGANIYGRPGVREGPGLKAGGIKLKL